MTKIKEQGAIELLYEILEQFLKNNVMPGEFLQRLEKRIDEGIDQMHDIIFREKDENTVLAIDFLVYHTILRDNFRDWVTLDEYRRWYHDYYTDKLMEPRFRILEQPSHKVHNINYN